MPGVVNGQDGSKSLTKHKNQNNSFDDNHLTYSTMKGGTRNRNANGYATDPTTDVIEDGPRYLLEHLATFSVGAEYGVVLPKDGIRRLLQMEKSNGIWTQKMQMKLDKNWVLILDFDNAEVVEKFPMNLISDPTAYTSEDPRELYNNILIFIVRNDPTNKNSNHSEMHIFQCSRVYAQDVVDEMKLYMSGKIQTKSADHARHLPPPPQGPPPDPPINGNSSKVRDHGGMFNSASSSTIPQPPPPRGGTVLQQRIERAAGYTRDSIDETSSTTSDKYEREVTILNHCFDDIERFVGRLQNSANASYELQKRQKSRKNKKKDMGDGMLSIRAKPPPEREFVDVLQKFKLAFNLLAKLKGHIHDPNAPELVHFLFTPLVLIVDAARENLHCANLASNVVSPLLTRDAIELLTNCCSSSENDLWHSLGDAWIMPRDQWKGYESNYRPVFSNGWAPENPFEENTTHRIQRPEGDAREQDYQRVFQGERDSRFGSEYFGSERGDDDRNESPGVVHPDHHPHLPPQQFERPYTHMPPDVRREYMEKLNAMPPTADFHDPRDRDMRSDFSSDSIEHPDLSLNPERHFDRQQLQWLDDLKSRRSKIVQVVYPRTANNEKELTVVRGEILEVLDDSRKWWKARNMRGEIAHVPHTIVTSYPAMDDDVFNNPVYGSTGRNYYSTEGSPMKDQYIEEGTTRSQDTSRSPGSRPAPADWVRRERQADPEKLVFVPRRFEMPAPKDEVSFPAPPPEYTGPGSPTFKVTSSSDNWLPPPPDFEPIPDLDISPVTKSYQSPPKDRDMSTPLMKSQTMSSPNRLTNNTSSRTPEVNRISCYKPHDKQSVSDAAFDMFQEDLRNSIAQRKWKKITCPMHHKTDCYYIHAKSPHSDVAHWLNLKGFSDRSIATMRAMSAEMLFNMKKAQLEKHLGEEEGARLHNHLMVQKNMSGYKTCSAKELNQILEERRLKAESVAYL